MINIIIFADSIGGKKTLEFDDFLASAQNNGTVLVTNREQRVRRFEVEKLPSEQTRKKVRSLMFLGSLVNCYRQV